jgi:hypothetical protein
MMKKILLLVASLPAVLFAQNTYTVSNIAGITADYSSLQGAIDSVPAGSTLLLFPSTISYGIGTLSKKLSIYGTGFMLDQNEAPFTSPNSSGVILDGLVFNPGSDNSFVEGLQLTDMKGVYTKNRIVMDSVLNVTVSRCSVYMRGFGPPLIATNTTLNCTFRQCYLVPRQPDAGFDASGGNLYQENGNGSQNLQFNNNIFDNRGSNSLGMAMNHNVPTQRLGSLFFTNNTIIAALQGSNFSNYTYTNNIFYNTYPQGIITPQSVEMNGAAINNITNSSVLFAAGSSNYPGANPDNIFSYSTFGFHSFDQKWQVVNNSFAKTFATDGHEAGAYGGDKPYVLSGIPNLPGIYAYSITTDGNKRGNILIRIKTKASN